MSIQKKSSRLGKGNALTKHQRRAAKLRLRCKMPPWNSNLLRPIGATASKISCTKVHISPWEKIIFWELGKHRCSHTLRITYCRKSDNWSCSVLKKKRTTEKKEHLLWRIPPNSSGSSYHCYLWEKWSFLKIPCFAY